MYRIFMYLLNKRPLQNKKKIAKKLIFGFICEYNPLKDKRVKGATQCEREKVHKT